MTDDWTVNSVTTLSAIRAAMRIRIEVLGQRAGQSGQLLGLAPPLLRSRGRARRSQRQRRLVGEGLRQPRILGVEDAPGAIGHRQGAEQPVAHDQR